MIILQSISGMKILLLDYVGYNSHTSNYSWQRRSPLPEELAPLKHISKAARRAASISPVFFSQIVISDLDAHQSYYSPVSADSAQDIMWLHQFFLREGVQNFTLNELTSIVLHEAAHHIQNNLPQQFQRILADDPAWSATLKRYPEISTNQSWFIETTADIYSIKMSGPCAITALEKLHQHACQHNGVEYWVGLFPQNYGKFSLSKRFKIMEFYAAQRDSLKEQSLLRLPMSARRSGTEYQTAQSTSDEEIGTDGRLNYFDWLVKEGGGYDFLASLLKWHPGVKVADGWQRIDSRETEDAVKQTQIRQFIHDVKTLMKLLLGSANLYVSEHGEFYPEELPYGAVRSNRAALTKTALHLTGSTLCAYNK